MIDNYASYLVALKARIRATGYNYIINRDINLSNGPI